MEQLQARCESRELNYQCQEFPFYISSMYDKMWFLQNNDIIICLFDYTDIVVGY